MTISPGIFKDYDIRAVVDEQLDTEGVERIGRAIAQQFQPKTVGIGRDMRLSGGEWFEALSSGLMSQGVDVVDLGLIATDMAYFAAGTLDLDLTVMISASHNPPQYNGFKIVKRGAAGVSGDTGIYDLRDLAISDTELPDADKRGNLRTENVMSDWIAHALSMIDPAQIKPFKVVIDAGNGMAGKVIPELSGKLPITVVPLFFELDGSFPNHLANPLLTETHQTMIDTIRAEKADLGIMFDGDGDRMFLFDETGRFISGTITTALVAAQMLTKNPESTILYNAICGRIVPQTVEARGGRAIRVKVGHTLIKTDMRTHDAVFAGEHSGHYYFRSNFSADSGLIASLIVLELMSQQNKKLSEFVSEFDTYPSSGEINFAVEDKEKMMKGLAEQFADAQTVDWLDGVSIWYADWWANIRPSNTQPVLRLNVEADSAKLLTEKTNEIIAYIESNGGSRAEE